MISTLAEAWMRGVAANPAAPSEVLLRLLDPAGRSAWTVLCEQRALPAAVVEAVLRHPEREVRRAFARNPFADPVDRGRLADDPDERVRASLAAGPRPRPGRPRLLPDDVVEKLLLAEDDGTHELITNSEIANELIYSGQIRPGLLDEAFLSADPQLRILGVGWLDWVDMSAQQREVLLSDPDPRVRAEAQRVSRFGDPDWTAAELPDVDCHYRSMLLVNFAVSRAVAEECLATRRDLWALAFNPRTPADIVARLALDPDPEVREQVASRVDIDPSLLARLADDADGRVRTRALVHPLPRTSAQRDAIDRVVGRTADQIGPGAGKGKVPDLDWFASCAVSEHPLRRRVAATCSNLPTELMRRLAKDRDPEVPRLLALHHPEAPADLLLKTFIDCPRQRAFLLTLPRLPRTGLSGLAAHDDPEVRALAAADPTLSSARLDGLLVDPDLRVRRAAAANPVLSVFRLTVLLSDPVLAAAAAANPVLAVDRLHGLLDRAGIPSL